MLIPLSFLFVRFGHLTRHLEHTLIPFSEINPPSNACRFLFPALISSRTFLISATFFFGSLGGPG